MDGRDDFLADERRGALARGEDVWVDAAGTSMSPALRPGDRLRLTATGPHGVRRGDMVALQRPGGLLVTHRVVSVDGSKEAPRVVTRGDNEMADDPPQPIEAVIGRVTARERLGAVVSLDGMRWRLGYPVARAMAALKVAVRARRSGRGRPAAASALAEACRLDRGARAPAWDGVLEDEWGDLAALLRRHRVAPWLKEHLGEDAPAWVTETVEKEALAWRAMCVGRLTGLDDALDAMGGTDIIVLKGAAFAESLYGSTCGRPFNDLDLVVRSEKVQDSVEALTAAGWVYRPRRRFRWQRSLEEHDLVPGAGPGAGLGSGTTQRTARGRPRIELHTGLVDKPEFAPSLARNPDWVWEEAVAATVADRRCLVLSSEATVVHAAIHWHLHSYAGLGWGLDLALAVDGRGGAVKWERVVALARRWQVANMTWVALSLARIEHGADVPKEVLAALRPRDPLARWIAGMVVRQPSALRGDRRKRIDQALVFTLRDRLWRRVGAALLLPWRVVFWVPEEDSAPD